jgi:hypothetical protein
MATTWLTEERNGIPGGGTRLNGTGADAPDKTASAS